MELRGRLHGGVEQTQLDELLAVEAFTAYFNRYGRYEVLVRAGEGFFDSGGGQRGLVSLADSSRKVVWSHRCPPRDSVSAASFGAR